MKKFAIILLILLPFFMYVMIMIVGMIFKPPAIISVSGIYFADSDGERLAADAPPLILIKSLDKGLESSLNLGKDKLNYQIIPHSATNKNVSFSVEPQGVLEVDGSGKLSPLRSGTAIATVTTDDGGITAHITVRVIGMDVEEIQSTQLEFRRKAGESISLKSYLSIIPTVSEEKMQVSYVSGNTAVASVSSDGMVFCHSAGQAAITVRSISNPSVSLVLEVVVEANYLSWDVPLTVITGVPRLMVGSSGVVLRVTVDPVIAVEGGRIKYVIPEGMEIDGEDRITIVGTSLQYTVKAVYVDLGGNPLRDEDGEEYSIELRCMKVS